MGNDFQFSMQLQQMYHSAAELVAWLGFTASLQDLAKAAVLAAFVLIILVILGDVYRGEIQNTFHRIRMIAHPAKDAQKNANLREALQLPKYMVEPTLDGIYSHALFYFRYRDYCGRLRTKPLRTYRVRLRVRKAYSDANAPGQEAKLHKYDDEERSALEKERPYSDAGRPISEIVSLAGSRVDMLGADVERRIAKEHQRWSNLEHSAVRRFIARVKKDDLVEPQEVGLVMKFHFPINPYFLLYKHPDTNIRSTAWLTVLTSVFALFMQIVYGPDPNVSRSQVAEERPTSAHVQVVATRR